MEPAIFFMWVVLLLPFISETSSSLATPASVAKLDVELEAINGTLNYRLYAKKGKDDKPWFDGLDSSHIQCVRRAPCYNTSNATNTCFGSKLPYEQSSLYLTDFHTEKELNEKLNDYYALRHVPKCWAAIQVRNLFEAVESFVHRYKYCSVLLALTLRVPAVMEFNVSMPQPGMERFIKAVHASLIRYRSSMRDFNPCKWHHFVILNEVGY